MLASFAASLGRDKAMVYGNGMKFCAATIRCIITG